MVKGIRCQHCETNTIPEQDGRSCSNCGYDFFTNKPGPIALRKYAPPGAPKDHVQKARHQWPIVDTAAPTADTYELPQRDFAAEADAEAEANANATRSISLKPPPATTTPKKRPTKKAS